MENSGVKGIRHGDPPRALISGHHHSLSPVVFAGNKLVRYKEERKKKIFFSLINDMLLYFLKFQKISKVVDHFNTLMNDASRLLRTSSVCQLLQVPLSNIADLAENGTVKKKE